MLLQPLCSSETGGTAVAQILAHSAVATLHHGRSICSDARHCLVSSQAASFNNVDAVCIAPPKPAAAHLLTHGPACKALPSYTCFTATIDIIMLTACDALCRDKEMVILGTQYAGEMKKGIFTVMHYLMPKRGILSLHSGCNVGKNDDVTLFFGLSGMILLLLLVKRCLTPSWLRMMARGVCRTFAPTYMLQMLRNCLYLPVSDLPQHLSRWHVFHNVSFLHSKSPCNHHLASRTSSAV